MVGKIASAGPHSNGFRWIWPESVWPVVIVTVTLLADPFAKATEAGLTEQVEFGGRFEQAMVTCPAKFCSGTRAKSKLADPPDFTEADVPFEPVTPHLNAATTFTEAVPVTVSAAEMVTLPRARLWTSPVALTVAVAVLDEVQVTE